MRDSSINQGTMGADIWTTWGGVIVLIALADVLFWGFSPGASIAVFALAVFGVAALRRGRWDGVTKPAVVMILAVLPVIEHVQLLSVLILMIGAPLALAWLRMGTTKGMGWIAAAALASASPRAIWGLGLALAALRQRWGTRQTGPSTFWRNWSLPLGGALILGALLLSANPVLAQLLAGLIEVDLNGVALVQRVLFWVGAALLIWPLLNPVAPRAPLSSPQTVRCLPLGLNGGSVLRALLVFNLFLGVQTMLDASILFGGAALPDGMTYATYAHRGAYPLMATAMLAGVFAIAARPFLGSHRALKPLLMLWLIQNLGLTFTAALRLDLYVAEYGLTYLRLYALIWMGLIAIGLGMVMWHTLRRVSAALLVKRLGALGLVTLYLCAFVNFAAVIAGHTIGRADANTDVDWAYLCALGPTASQAIYQGVAINPNVDVPLNVRACFVRSSARPNWRETDLRRVRTDVSG